MRMHERYIPGARDTPCTPNLREDESREQHNFPFVAPQIRDDAAVVNQGLPRLRRVAKANDLYTFDSFYRKGPLRMRSQYNHLKSAG